MRVIIYGAGENCKSVVGKIQKKDEILCIADKDALKIGGVEYFAPRELLIFI